MTYRTRNPAFARGLTAALAAAAALAVLLGFGGPLGLIGVYAAWRCLTSFNEGLETNPRNRT